MADRESRRPPIEVILWRHGSTEQNEAGIIPGQLDVALSARGHEEAAEAAVKLASWNPGLIVSSDLMRAQATALYLTVMTGAEILLDARLRETSLGTWEGLTRSQAEAAHPAEYAAWRSGADVARGGGETARAVAARARESVEEALAKQSSAAGMPLVVVTHAGTARAVTGDLLGLPAPSWTRLATLANGAWSALGRDHLGWQLIAHNVCASRDTVEPA